MRPPYARCCVLWATLAPAHTNYIQNTNTQDALSYRTSLASSNVDSCTTQSAPLAIFNTCVLSHVSPKCSSVRPGRAASSTCSNCYKKSLKKIWRERTSDGCTTRPPASVTELPAFNSPSIFPLGMPRRATVSIFILQQPSRLVTPATPLTTLNTAASYLPGLSGSVSA